ncbi:hypothetical protein NPIL_353391 [Nephila pilipes]|uniref:Uncharacterized protein n=1 Tax=Nephila pilipes TaxID=299642 RepID=A0A8X6U283_NEPPI|nr:hypothetical protein NPIL_353391 [Nephila pilipes]
MIALFQLSFLACEFIKGWLTETRGCSWEELGKYVRSYAPDRVTLGMKVIPLCPAKVKKHWSQSSTIGALILGHRSCPFPPSMNKSPEDFHAASVVTHSKKDHVLA